MAGPDYSPLDKVGRVLAQIVVVVGLLVMVTPIILRSFCRLEDSWLPAE
jgi:hypothetical protein